VEICETDAKPLGIVDGTEVKLTSEMGEVTAAARITDTLPPGTLFMPKSFPDTYVNRLFNIVLDQRSKTPSIKACKVRLERNGSNG
jgi:predicted molibdopterin-dependent oxidoreductase YjgC